MTKDEELTVAERQRDILAQTIHIAAEKAGLVEKDVELSGPQILMLASDLGDALAAVRKERFDIYRTLVRVRDKLNQPDLHISNDVPGAKRLLRELMSQLTQDKEVDGDRIESGSAEA